MVHNHSIIIYKDFEDSNTILNNLKATRLQKFESQLYKPEVENSIFLIQQPISTFESKFVKTSLYIHINTNTSLSTSIFYFLFFFVNVDENKFTREHLKKKVKKMLLYVKSKLNCIKNIKICLIT